MSSDALVAWEQRLRERLGRVGSTECSLSWTRGSTPTGARISALVTRRRRPTDPEYSGTLWSTPLASSVMEGPDTVVARAAMHLRVARMTGRRTNFSGGFPLAACMQAAGRFGGRGGRPNPIFACWLMGFPDAWVEGALRSVLGRKP